MLKTLTTAISFSSTQEYSGRFQIPLFWHRDTILSTTIMPERNAKLFWSPYMSIKMGQTVGRWICNHYISFWTSEYHRVVNLSHLFNLALSGIVLVAVFQLNAPVFDVRMATCDWLATRRGRGPPKNCVLIVRILSQNIEILNSIILMPSLQIKLSEKSFFCHFLYQFFFYPPLKKQPSYFNKKNPQNYLFGLSIGICVKKSFFTSLENIKSIWSRISELEKSSFYREIVARRAKDLTLKTQFDTSTKKVHQRSLWAKRVKKCQQDGQEFSLDCQWGPRTGTLAKSQEEKGK